MPLPEPEARDPMHCRQVICRGYRRQDGLWDIEGHLCDTKDYDFTTRWRGDVPAGDPIHDMWIRLTVDNEFVVRDVQVSVDKSPYPICPAVIPNLQRLKGIPIARGWRRAVRTHLGGTEGCTHLVEMLFPLATAAFQTIYPARIRDEGQAIENLAAGDKPMLLNTCHAYAESSPIVQELYPAHYRAASDPTRSAEERS